MDGWTNTRISQEEEEEEQKGNCLPRERETRVQRRNPFVLSFSGRPGPIPQTSFSPTLLLARSTRGSQQFFFYHCSTTAVLCTKRCTLNLTWASPAQLSCILFQGFEYHEIVPGVPLEVHRAQVGNPCPTV